MHIVWDPSFFFHPNALGEIDKGIPLPKYGLYGGVNYSAGEVGGVTPYPLTLAVPQPVDE